jgi:DNA repair exonuclease SbcCD ATPase subunit
MATNINKSPDISNNNESSSSKDLAVERGREIVGSVVDKMSGKLYEVVGRGAMAVEKGVGLFELGLKKVENALDRFNEWVEDTQEAVENKVEEIQEKTRMNWGIFKDKAQLLGVKPFSFLEGKINEIRTDRAEKKAKRDKKALERKEAWATLFPSKVSEVAEGVIESIDDKIERLMKERDAWAERMEEANEAINEIREERERDLERVNAQLLETKEDILKNNRANELLNTIRKNLREKEKAKTQKYPGKGAGSQE